MADAAMFFKSTPHPLSDMSKREIRSILERNRRVETDKAWETSYTRRTIIAVLTCVVVVVFLHSIGAPRPWLNALVPCAGYVLSTISMSWYKQYWAKSFNAGKPLTVGKKRRK